MLFGKAEGPVQLYDEIVPVPAVAKLLNLMVDSLQTVASSTEAVIAGFE